MSAQIMNELISEDIWFQLFINPIWMLLIMIGLILFEWILAKYFKNYQCDKSISILIYVFTYAGILGMTYDNRIYIQN